MCTVTIEHGRWNLYDVPLYIWHMAMYGKHVATVEDDGIRYVEICHKTNKPRRAAE